MPAQPGPCTTRTSARPADRRSRPCCVLARFRARLEALGQLRPEQRDRVGPVAESSSAPPARKRQTCERRRARASPFRRRARSRRRRSRAPRPRLRRPRTPPTPPGLLRATPKNRPPGRARRTQRESEETCATEATSSRVDTCPKARTSLSVGPIPADRARHHRSRAQQDRSLYAPFAARTRRDVLTNHRHGPPETLDASGSNGGEGLLARPP